jgi:hypothetical protein
MSELLNSTPAAREWVEKSIVRLGSKIFGKLISGVIWTDAQRPDGELIIPIVPEELVRKINQNPHILLHNHDPGHPKGQVLECAQFESLDGKRFIAAILGYYAGGQVLSFRDVGLDADLEVPSPPSLPDMPEETWMQIATDPREIDGAWMDLVAINSPVPLIRTELSHNAAEAHQELIRLGLIFLALVWNPYVTSIATEAGKATYKATHSWIRQLLERMVERRSPVLDFHTQLHGCQISFLLRGNNLKKHYAAHDGLPEAAAQAEALITRIKARGVVPRQLVYEFDQEAIKWAPSFAVLNDDRIITDNVALLAIEQLPNGLSLGLSREKQLFPSGVVEQKK